MMTLEQLAVTAAPEVGDAVVTVLVAFPDAFLRAVDDGRRYEVSVARGSRSAFPVAVGKRGDTPEAAVLNAQAWIWR